MAYKALYRTYRPTSFDEVAGQSHIVQTLKNAVNQNKIAHAYLFCGPRGTGKTSIAKIFAKAVNCESEHDKPCMQCENCKAITENSHPDIVEIDAASNNGVEEVRSLIEKVKYAPIKGKYKVYIIDEVHMMSAGAFNALLKTIEEPPAHVIFILATTEPHKVLPTIISRCQRYDFNKVPQTEIIERLKTILDAEKIQCEDEVLRIIAQLADGGMRDALSILDQCIAYAQNDLKEHHINEVYGITTVKEKIEMFECIYSKNASELLKRVHTMIEKGIDMKRLTVDLIEILKESVIYDYTGDLSLLEILDHDEMKLIQSGSNITQRLKMIDTLMETYDKYRFAANVGSYFEVCILKMMGTVDQPSAAIQKGLSPIEPKVTEVKVDKILTPPVVDVSRETIKKPSHIDDIVDTDPELTPEEENSIPLEEEHVPETLLTEQSKVESSVTSYNKSAQPLDDEFVLQLLVGANKPEKMADMQSFQNIKQYTFELEWAKCANMLKGIEIMASSERYLIVAVGNQAEANDINERDSKNEFHEFTNVLFHKYKKLFAVPQEQKNRVIQNFKQRMAEKTLPPPAVIEEVKIEKKEKEKELSEEEAVLNLFGKENIIITEE